MRTRPIDRLIAHALLLAMMVQASGAWAGSSRQVAPERRAPSRDAKRYFSPAEPRKTWQVPKPMKRAGAKMRRARQRLAAKGAAGEFVAHPYKGVTEGAEQGKAKMVRAALSGRIRNLEAGRRGDGPSLTEWRAREKRWVLDGGKVDADDFAALNDAPFVVGSAKAVDVELKRPELEHSIATTRTELQQKRALLPAGVSAKGMESFLALAHSTILSPPGRRPGPGNKPRAPRRIFGATEVADVLDSAVVASDVIEAKLDELERTPRTPAGGDWLSPAVRELAREQLDNGDRAGARSTVAFGYGVAAATVKAQGKTYQVKRFSMAKAATDPDSLPLEIRAAIQQRPELEGELVALERELLAGGADPSGEGVLQIRTLKHTPPAARLAALENGALGQETHFAAFVKQVGQGLRPKAGANARGKARMVEAGRMSENRSAEDIDADLERGLDLIDNTAAQAMTIEAVPGRAANAARLRKINRDIEPVRRWLGVFRIVHDVKHETGEGARKILLNVAMLATLATGAQALGAKEIAILIAESGEDIFQGLAEGASQSSVLATSAEVWRLPTKIAMPAAVGGAVVSAKGIHDLAHHGWQDIIPEGLAAGAAAGLWTGAMAASLSAVIFTNSVTFHRQQHENLLRAGSIEDTLPKLMYSDDFQKRLRQQMRRNKHVHITRDVIADARRALTGVVDAEEVDRAVTMLERTTGEARKAAETAARGKGKTASEVSRLGEAAARGALAKAMRRPTRAGYFKEGFNVALGTPMRRFLGQGMLVTLGASTTLGFAGVFHWPAWAFSSLVAAGAGEGGNGLFRGYRLKGENDFERQITLQRLAEMPMAKAFLWHPYLSLIAPRKALKLPDR